MSANPVNTEKSLEMSTSLPKGYGHGHISTLNGRQFTNPIQGAFLLKGRVERPKRPFQLDFSALQDKRFVILLTTAFFEYFAYVIPFFLTPEYCTYAGFGSGA
ncbi:hypothetical protein K493DRAFT_393342 [Basidiobolus meristosporus CBS 931.73]|uniref:Major facilitator superfamily (MFS) profile domain-containing protein n=1 Tax=Basidiobolus meristosporus CBS 931.73 TaxID=1314790 RepID=A0A1Y1WS20_9FUNG|nr:hypothetical protein K493DRAFT_393342 [Basidiobolus meristosporus CBS 931.73]|eukprot:ORX76339.1 hypothetical protein K493DRAFT_393342 [Basidiobolus meristosporus CBS 931.73]